MCVCVCWEGRGGGGGVDEFVLSGGWLGFPLMILHALLKLILRLPASRYRFLFPAISKHSTNCVRSWQTDKLAFNMRFVGTN